MLLEWDRVYIVLTAAKIFKFHVLLLENSKLPGLTIIVAGLSWAWAAHKQPDQETLWSECGKIKNNEVVLDLTE